MPKCAGRDFGRQGQRLHADRPAKQAFTLESQISGDDPPHPCGSLGVDTQQTAQSVNRDPAAHVVERLPSDDGLCREQPHLNGKPCSMQCRAGCRGELFSTVAAKKEVSLGKGADRPVTACKAHDPVRPSRANKLISAGVRLWQGISDAAVRELQQHRQMMDAQGQIRAQGRSRMGVVLGLIVVFHARSAAWLDVFRISGSVFPRREGDRRVSAVAQAER